MDTTAPPYPYNVARTFRLADGDAGTEQTAAGMSALIHHADDSPSMRDYAQRLQRSASPIRDFFALCKNHIVFRADAPGVEHLRHPDQLLADLVRDGVAYGDCDDLTCFALSVLRHLGVSRVAIVVVGREPSGPFEHVMAAIVRQDAPENDIQREQLCPFDPQEAPALGAWPAGIQRVRAFPVAR